MQSSLLPSASVLCYAGLSILGGDGERASLEAPAEGTRGPAKRSAAKQGEPLRGGPAPLL